jgi:hypothetical protein
LEPRSAVDVILRHGAGSPLQRDERPLSIADEALAARFAIIENYVQRANEIGLEQWTRRGGGHKLKDTPSNL